MFEDTVNRSNPIEGKIIMSNLCSEILQVSKPSIYHDDLSYAEIGKDISCNLGSLNIAMTMDGDDLGKPSKPLFVRLPQFPTNPIFVPCRLSNAVTI